MKNRRRLKRKGERYAELKSRLIMAKAILAGMGKTNWSTKDIVTSLYDIDREADYLLTEAGVF